VLMKNAEFRLMLESYLGDALSLHELRLWIAAKFPPQESYHIALYAPVMTHLAMHSAGEWGEAELKAALCWHLASIDGQQPTGVPPMIDSHWIAMQASGQMPWPLKAAIPSIIRIEDGAVVEWGLELVGH
jgi:hypothetical protein